MYSGAGFSDWEIGDITVYIHNGEYHLFHLIIPNHDYIAHAVSKDGLAWRRTKNAIFVGDPGEWDDDMLWTMHVYSQENKFFMYLYFKAHNRKAVSMCQEEHWERKIFIPLTAPTLFNIGQ